MQIHASKMIPTTDASSYINRAAYVKAYGRSIKVDDVSLTLSRKARVVGSWSDKKLPSENAFFVAYPSCEVVHYFISLGHIRGDGFTLVVNHWDQTIEGTQNKLRFKVCASLFNLLLIYWNVNAIASIIANFRVPLRANHSSINMEDLTSLDLHFLCENLESISEFIEVTVRAFCYRVRLVVNFSSPYNPFLDHSSSQSEDHSNLGDSDLEFWFGLSYRRQPSDPYSCQDSASDGSSPKRHNSHPTLLQGVTTPSLSTSPLRVFRRLNP